MSNYLSFVKSHLHQLVSAESVICQGMWPSVLDVRTKNYPQEDYVPKRVYRLIGAPRGSTLYWDQPSIVTCYVFSKITGDPQFETAAYNYIKSFSSYCVAPNGMFHWGNHMYYDQFKQKVISFSGGHHELRPITPAWEIFWKIIPEQTTTYIRQMAERHIYNPDKPGYWPRYYSDPWNTDQWPTHDYPMSIAEACLSLNSVTSKSFFLDMAYQMADLALKTSPEKTNRWAYAESYGRCIHFLTRFGNECEDTSYLNKAQMLAERAIDCLFENEMFKGFTTDYYYESVDGVGFLLLALLFLQHPRPIDFLGLGF